MKYGIDFQYVSYNEYLKYDIPDIVINRTRDFKVSQMYESQGVKVYNPAYLTYIGNNKYESIRYLSEHLSYDVTDKKWTANTLFIKSSELSLLPDNEYMYTLIQRVSGLTDSGIVIKSVDGHGGSDVFLLEADSSAKMRKNIADKLSGHDCIIQEKIDSNSSDIRVYIVGGKIYTAMLRMGTRDFRSNYSLGGTAEEYKLDNTQKCYIMKFVNALGDSKIGMAGIDFILARNGELFFNEVEEMAGSRMLYKHTSYDIVKDYVQWILKTQKEANLV